MTLIEPGHLLAPGTEAPAFNSGALPVRAHVASNGTGIR